MALRIRATFLEVIGSLWFAAVLLALLLVAMAAATVHETRHGTDQALHVFYRSWWFAGLLGLLALNIVTAVVVRAPFTRHQIGFLVTHFSILLIFVGALVTKYAGLDGRLIIGEGRTAAEFQLSDRPVLSVRDEAGQLLAASPLNPSVFMGFEESSNPGIPPMVCGDLRIEIRRYLPDGEESRRLVDDRPNGKLAIEAAFVSDAHDFHTWVFAGGTSFAGELPVAFTLARSAEEQEKWVAATQPAESESKGTVKIEYQDRTYSYPLEPCLERPVAVGETGYSVHVTRYLPHAVVGTDKKIVGASSQPANPYIEAELIGPDGTETRRAFAKFPDMDGLHGPTTSRALRLTFETPNVPSSAAPAEVLAGPDGRLFVRFSEMGGIIRTTELAVGTPVETPWAGWKFVVRERRKGARWEQTVVPVVPVRKEGRQQAVQLAVRGDWAVAADPRVGRGEADSTGGAAVPQTEAWVMYGQPASVEVGGRFYDLHFDDALHPMGFQVKLDGFRVVTYPGTQKPRSFESRVTIQDPRAGGELSRVISMNHPLAYGGYTFYQSSYSREGAGFVSVLSVSRDPGQAVVFAGYVAMLVGMVWELVRRMQERKKG